MEIQVENVMYQKGEKILLDQINMSIKKGVTTFLGSSGSSKTTLLQVLCGTSPTMGKVSYIKDHQIQKVTIVFLPTYLDSFFKKEFVYEEIEYFETLCGKEKSSEILSLLGFTKDLYSHKIRNLRNCDQKFLALFDLLMQNPDIIVLDEPIIDLSLAYQKKIEKILFYLKRNGKIIILSTNQSDFALKVSDFVYILQKGKIIGEGEKYQLLKKTLLLKKAGLSAPKTISFSKKVERYKKIKIGYRDDINDLIKDIFRYV